VNCVYRSLCLQEYELDSASRATLPEPPGEPDKNTAPCAQTWDRLPSAGGLSPVWKSGSTASSVQGFAVDWLFRVNNVRRVGCVETSNRAKRDGDSKDKAVAGRYNFEMVILGLGKASVRVMP